MPVKEDQSVPSHTGSTLEDVETYRSLFAEVLVLGSTLQGLKGDDQARFERRTSLVGPAPASATAPAPRDITTNSGTEAADTEERQRALGHTVDGLKGLPRFMYRQHARKLQRAYSVA